jgi:hypothetical protein
VKVSKLAPGQMSACLAMDLRRATRVFEPLRLFAPHARHRHAYLPPGGLRLGRRAWWATWHSGQAREPSLHTEQYPKAVPQTRQGSPARRC